MNLQKAYIVKNSEIFQIIQNHKFKNTQMLIEDIAGKFENIFNFILLRPLKLYIKKGFERKATEISKKWKQFNGGFKRKKYLESLENSFFEIEIKREDIEYGILNIDALKETKKKLQATKRELERASILINEFSIVPARKRKNYMECSLKHQKRIKLLIQKNVRKYVESFGLNTINMHLIKLISTNSDNFFKLIITEYRKNVLKRINVLPLKDQTNISDHAYSLLQKHGASQWPTVHYIRKERVLLSKVFYY